MPVAINKDIKPPLEYMKDLMGILKDLDKIILAYCEGGFEVDEARGAVVRAINKIENIEGEKAQAQMSRADKFIDVLKWEYKK